MSVKTVYLDEDELYPCFSVRTEPRYFSRAVNVDNETLARWERVTSEFFAVQKEMGAAIDAAEEAR